LRGLTWSWFRRRGLRERSTGSWYRSLYVPPFISKMAFFFSVTLIVLIPRKVENKRKVATYISYVVHLYKLGSRTFESEGKVRDKLDLK